ncbi:MAG: AbrB/MazE/SpoVT family DNA-binding domain-containing protein [Firmicutes bacterium]|nr:AbrB/MazE/SpoVT family DNA-binding domain-containing protein [Bacillota bacterium]
MELSRVSANGQLTVPKAIRERLNLREGDRVAFVEESGRVILTKATVLALRDLQETMQQEAEAQRLVEEDLLRELERVREERWDERHS